MRTLLTSLALVAMTTLIFGCGGRIRDAVSLPNPLITGQVSANKAEERRDWYVEEHELHAPWVNDAAIVALDDHEACFDVHLKWIKDPGEPVGDDSFVDINKLIPSITGQPGLKWNVKTAKPISHSTAPGVSREARTHESKLCDKNGHDCDVALARSIETGAVEFAVAEGGGTLCAANEGQFSKQTSSIVLVLSPPALPNKATHRFAWKFIEH